jgi:hypothetical protein
LNNKNFANVNSLNGSMKSSQDISESKPVDSSGGVKKLKRLGSMGGAITVDVRIAELGLDLKVTKQVQSLFSVLVDHMIAQLGKDANEDNE